MYSGDRTKLIRFLAQNGIRADAFSDAELRQEAQKVLSSQKLKKKVKQLPGKAAGSLSTKKIPDK